MSDDNFGRKRQSCKQKHTRSIYHLKEHSILYTMIPKLTYKKNFSHVMAVYLPPPNHTTWSMGHRPHSNQLSLSYVCCAVVVILIILNITYDGYTFVVVVVVDVFKHDFDMIFLIFPSLFLSPSLPTSFLLFIFFF